MPQLAALVLFGLSMGGCRPDVQPKDVQSHLIAGTETVQSDVISVSVDERWLVFSEENPETIGRGAYGARLSSIELGTVHKTAHRIDHLPDRALKSADEATRWDRVSGYLSAGCWNDGRCYINTSGRLGYKDLVLIPGVPELEIAPLPEELNCSDCPPLRLAATTARERGVSNLSEYSIAFRNGQLANDMYYGETRDGAASIWTVDESGQREKVLEVRVRFKSATIEGVRVSPDERFLAYVVGSKLKAPVPTPDMIDEVFVRELDTGREVRIGKYRIVGNLLWSADSRRIYYPAFGQDPKDKGVYRADATELLDHQE